MQKLVSLMAVLLLTACVQKPGQDVYKAKEVGVSRAVEFGTVLAVREVTIAAENKGAGTMLGAGVGAGAGSYVGQSDGNAWAVAGAAIAGAVIGNAIEEELGASQGYEYTVSLRSGDIKMIVQEKIEGDDVFKPGDKVMLQYCDAGAHNKKCKPDVSNLPFQRLLRVDQFPPEPEHKKKKKKKSSNDDDDY